MKIYFSAILYFITNLCFSQIHSRIEADFSLKENNFDGSQNLTMGRVYYDLTYNKLVYSISFPEKMTLVIKDTMLYEIKDGKIIQKAKTIDVVNLSIFYLALHGDLPYYGLKKSIYKLINVENSDSMVISTWEMPEKSNSSNGKILLSQVKKRLYGLIIYDKAGIMLSKQIFEEYKNINGLDFPTQIVQFSYTSGKEETKLVNYKNLVVNNMKNEDFYNFLIPGN